MYQTNKLYLGVMEKMMKFHHFVEKVMSEIYLLNACKLD